MDGAIDTDAAYRKIGFDLPEHKQGFIGVVKLDNGCNNEEYVGKTSEGSVDDPNFGQDDELAVEQIGKEFHQMLQVHVSDQLTCDDMSAVENANPSRPLDECDGNGVLLKCLTKCSTFPSSGEVDSPSHAKKKQGLLSKLFEDPSSISESPAYARSISMPASLELLSAMKGGRELGGIASKTDLRVKWAAEVYDPPCTTVSHTVKDHRGRHQRSKGTGKKDNYKNNKHKGKSSKGSSSSSYDRRKACQRSSSNNAGVALGTMGPKLRGARDGVLLLDGRDAQMAAELLSDYSAIGRQEGKCGGSRLLEEALSKLHLPIAS